MSAGNQVLCSNLFADATTTTHTLLGAGNYWIEEGNIVIAYATTNNLIGYFFSLVCGTTLWAAEFVTTLPSGGGFVNEVINLPVIFRPRIFCTRNAPLQFTYTNSSPANLTNLTYSVNIYGRILP